MSKVIDEKIVSLELQNQEFERNAKTSLGTIAKLKQGLNFKGVDKGIESINVSANKLNKNGLGIIGNTVDGIKVKFSAMEVMAVTALSNITNKAIATGERVVKALTIDPIKSGFEEYETQMGAIQTILANTQSKGSTLQDVNSALDELNTYADKTIYNFTEMTRNIGTFTAAGVDLDKSVSSIKGIANLAAISGSTSQQASVAMYQLSQALAAGTVKLQDWNSVVNAGMGGQLFQDALKRTAEHMGTNVDAMIEKYGSFRESLSKGEWLTTEVLTETLAQLSGAYTEADLIAQGYTESQAKEISELAKTAVSAATEVKTFTQLLDTTKEAVQSGWSQTWRILIGDFGESKELLTSISDAIGGVINASSEARNKLLTEGLSSGWKQILNQGISDEELFKDTIKDVAKEHKVSLDEMIKNNGSFEKSLKEGWLTSDILTQSIDKMTEKVNGMSEEQRKSSGYTQEQIDKLNELNKAIKDGTIDMEEFAEKMSMPSGRENIIEGLTNIVKGIGSVITPIKEAFREIFPPSTGEQLYKITENFKKLTAQFKISEETASNIKDTFRGVFGVFKIGADILGAIGKVFSGVVKGVFSIGDAFLKVTAPVGNFFGELAEGLEKSNVFSRAADGIINTLGSLFSAIANFGGPAIQAFGSGIKTIIDSMANAISSIGEGLGSIFQNGGLNGLLDALNSGIFATILLKLRSFIKDFTGALEDDSNNIFSKLKESLTGLTNILDSVRGSLEVWQTNLKVGILLKIASAVAILAGSLVVLSSIDQTKLTDALGAITTLFIELMAAMNIAASFGAKGFEGIGKSISAITLMIGMSTSILVLSSALKKLSEIDAEKIGTSLTALAVTFGELIVATKLMGSSAALSTRGSFALIKFATAISILAKAVEQLSALSVEEITRGLGAIGGLLLELSIFTKLFQPTTRFASAAFSIIGLSTALLLLEIPLGKMGNMKFDAMIQGLIGVGSALAIFAVYTKMVSNENLFSMSIGLNIMAASLYTIAESFEVFKDMKTENITSAMMAMVSTLAMITIAGKVLDGANLDSFESSMLFMSVALLIIAQAMKQVSGLSFEDVGTGLTALAGGMSMMIIAAKLLDKAKLKKSIDELILMSGALLLMSTSIKMLGAGGIIGAVSSILALAGTLTVLGIAIKVMRPMIGTMMSLSGSIVAFSGSLVVLGAAAAVVGLGTSIFITSLAASIALLTQLDPKHLVSGLIAVAGAFVAVGLAAKLLKGSEAALFSFAGTVAALGLSFLAVGLAISTVTGALVTLASVGEEGVQIIISALTGLLTGILEIIPKTISSLVEAGKSLILGLLDILVETAPEIVDGIGKILVETLGSLTKYAPQIIDFLLTFLIKIIDGLTLRVPELMTSIGNLLDAIFTSLMDAISKANPDALLKGVAAVGAIVLLAKTLGSLSALLPLAMKGLLAAGVLIAELSLILAAVGGLAQIPGLEWLVSEGGTFLKAVGTAVGQFIGGITGGIMDGVTSSLPNIGTNLSDFMKNLKPFLDGAKDIDSSVATSVASLAKAVLTITAVDVINGLTSWFTGGSSVADFASDLADLGKGLKDFSTSVNGVDPQQILAASLAAEALAKMTSHIPNEGGLLAWIVGENSITKFAGELPTLGAGLKGFSDSVAGINAENITSAATAAEALAKMTSHIPNEGGMLAWFVGENSISKFADELPKLGKGLKGFSDSIAGVKGEDIISAASAAKAIAEMTSYIPNEGGLVAWFKGDNSISTFSENLSDLGKGLKGFSDSVIGISAESTLAASETAKNLSTMISSLPENVGVMTTFGNNLKTFGDSLKAYFDKTSSISGDSVTASKNAIQAIKEVCEVDTTPLKTITKHIDDAAKAIDKLSSVTSDTIVSFTVSLRELGETSVDSFLKSFKDLDTKVKDIATKAMDSFASGIKSKDESASSACETVVKTCATTLEGYYENFKSAGKYLVEGFAKGISVNTYMASAQASAMASAAEKAARAELDINSPSKVLEKVGMSVPEGFANGISKLAGLVKKSAYSMANVAVSGSKNAMLKLSNMIDSGIDVEPRITPVMDLSGISSGIKDMDSMLGGTHGIGITANLRAISTAMRQNQNGANDDVVNAINKLRKDLGDFGGDTYNVNGVSVNDTDVAEAIKTLVRAVKVGRRV